MFTGPFPLNVGGIAIVCTVGRFWISLAIPEIFAIKVWSGPKLTEILHVFGPKFFGGAPPNFWSGIIKFSQIPTMWQSSGRSVEELGEPVTKQEKRDTSPVKHKPVRNGGCGRPNKLVSIVATVQTLLCVQRVWQQAWQARGFYVDFSTGQLHIQHCLSHQSVYQLPVRCTHAGTCLSQLTRHCRSQTQRHLPSINRTTLSTSTSDVTSAGSCDVIVAVDTQYYTGSGGHCHHLYCCSRCRTHGARRWHSPGSYLLHFNSLYLFVSLFFFHFYRATLCVARS